jgi:adenylate cyclase
VGADWLPSLAWAGAEVAHDPITADPAAARRKRWLNYYGPPLRLPKIPYHQALLQPVPEGFFRDKVVFVGAGATVGLPGEIKDEFAGPHTRWTGRLHSGVEIQATAYLNLARKDWLTRLPGGWELLLLVLTGTALGCGLAGLRPAWASLAAVLFLLGLGGVAVWLFVHARVWFSWTLIAVVQLPVAWGCSVVWNSIRLYGEKKALEQSLALHLSPARVRQILRRPELLRPGAEEQEISILFSDIANFTRLTSRMPSADLFRLLNDYYEVALSCIHETDGTVVNLIGDAIFAIWNAPFTQPDQQARAFQSALLLREKLVQFEANQRSLPLHTRVGLHTGLAHVGNLGSSKRFEYTAVGDSVNLASRLEGLNKQTGTDILATRDIQRLVENHVASRSLGFFRFKGFDRIIEVHELLGPAALAPSTEPWRKTFQDGMFHFQRKAFDPAEAAFRQTLALKPEDGPSLFYLDRLREVRLTPPPDEWAGEITLKEK